ncbi:MAG: DnaB-like helicase C-terminal domain-containing protein [Planctomycetota bacterium]|nr:DnaB-like helicase C-terminal domain-containing protein [Planctomycetota bacterium]
MNDITRVQTLVNKYEEACLLGSLILDSGKIPEVLEIVPNEEWLLAPRHKLFWRVIMRLYDKNAGKGVDGVLVRSEIEPELGEEGVAYLREMLDTVPTAASAKYYAEKVREKCIRRNLLNAGQHIASLALSVDEIGTIMDKSQQALGRVCDSAGVQATTVSSATAVQQAFAEIETKIEPCVQSDYVDLSSLVPGFTPGQMVILAGRPAHGKSSLALSLLMRNFTRNDEFRALFISLEMSATDLMKRALASVTSISYTTLAREQLTGEEFAKIAKASNQVGAWDFLMADYIEPTPQAVRLLARKCHKVKPLNVLVVDYIQRMRWPGSNPSRNEEMTKISNSLKNLAMELQIPILAVSQLNRACDTRENHRPRISDLRDSGTLEQEGDVIMLLYRADCYEPDTSQHTGTAEVHVAKQRNGPVGKCELTFRQEIMTFENHIEEMFNDL